MSTDAITHINTNDLPRPTAREKDGYRAVHKIPDRI
jgi:hypothetical protein